MSNGNGISFVHDLVAMATAADKVPQLEARIAELEKIESGLVTTVQDIEKRLIDAHSAHDETRARLRNAEVARDDAEFRFLEADDAKLVAVRTMRTVVAEAEAFVKAMTPKEEEPVRPDYSGKYLCDLQGWMGITYEQWLEHGGSSSRYVLYKPLEATAAPNGPSESISSSAVQVEVKEAEGSSDGPFTSTTSQDLGGGEDKRPDGGMSWEEAAKAAEGKGFVVEKVVAEFDPATGELSVSANPIAETLIGSTGETVHSQSVGSSNAVSAEGNNPDPFASKTTIQSEHVSSTGAEAKESAHTADSDSELWAIPSRASHQSG
jgi:hypothetical protein